MSKPLINQAALSKDIKKHLDKESVSTELSPGSGRRYAPNGGTKAHVDRIHKESEISDRRGTLPFTFSKPKSTARRKVVACKNCGHVSSASINTVGVICFNCKIYSAVEEVNDG